MYPDPSKIEVIVNPGQYHQKICQITESTYKLIHFTADQKNKTFQQILDESYLYMNDFNELSILHYLVGHVLKA